MKPSDLPEADIDNEIEDDPVWKLLEKSSKAEAGPFFSRNVLREVRKLDDRKMSVWQQFLAVFRQPMLALPATAAVAVAVAIFATSNQPSGDLTGGVAEVDAVDAFDPTEEVEALSNFGELMAVVDPAELSDDAIADLLF